MYKHTYLYYFYYYCRSVPEQCSNILMIHFNCEAAEYRMSCKLCSFIYSIMYACGYKWIYSFYRKRCWWCNLWQILNLMHRANTATKKQIQNCCGQLCEVLIWCFNCFMGSFSSLFLSLSLSISLAVKQKIQIEANASNIYNCLRSLFTKFMFNKM